MAYNETPGFQTYHLRKKQGVGFGIAISGGTENAGLGPGTTGSIVISDVVARGPAVGKLEIGDKVIMVQNQSCVGMTRVECVNLMKAAGNTISISVVRTGRREEGAGNPYNQKHQHHRNQVLGLGGI